MAKPSASDSIMAPDKMKPLLALSKREPVQAALGISADGEGVILLDKKAKPKRVLSMLKSGAAKAKLQLNSASLRFGRAEVDPEYDPATIRFSINKEPPGPYRIKMVELVRRIPYQKVEFHVDPSLEEEPEEETEQPQAEASAPDVATVPAAATPAASVPPPPPPLNAAANLMTQLRELIGRVGQATGERKAMMAKLAGAASEAIKANDPTRAAEAIGQLRAALATPVNSQAAAAPTTNGSPAGPVAYGKARLIWLSTRKKVMGDIDRLMEALRTHYSEEETGLGDDIAGQFTEKVAPVMAAFDESLADALDAAINQTEPGPRAERVAEAKAIVERYEAYLGSEPLIGWMDANPLVPVTIATTLSTTLKALSATIH
jgi:hypothetical protein